MLQRKKGIKAAYIIILGPVAIPENLENLRRSLERNDGLRGNKIEIVSYGDQPRMANGSRASPSPQGLFGSPIDRRNCQ